RRLGENHRAQIRRPRQRPGMRHQNAIGAVEHWRPPRDDGTENPYILRPRPPSETMITSKLTSKAQTTIPLPVRNALRLGPGDQLAYAIEGERVILTKSTKLPSDDPFGAFHEWSSEADREGYA